jgi:hypothetical protein
MLGDYYGLLRTLRNAGVGQVKQVMQTLTEEFVEIKINSKVKLDVNDKFLFSIFILFLAFL